jgi:hypothetical protein
VNLAMRKTKHAPTFLPAVRPPFRAEAPKNRVGEWRKHIEEAMDDARGMGVGARVVSQDGILLARFENAARYVTPQSRDYGMKSKKL